MHLDFRTALRHADNRYGNALTALAHEALRADKYKAMCDFIEAALPRFQELAALAADRNEERGE